MFECYLLCIMVVYWCKCDVMCDVLCDGFGDVIEFYCFEGGMFVWVWFGVVLLDVLL